MDNAANDNGPATFIIHWLNSFRVRSSAHSSPPSFHPLMEPNRQHSKGNQLIPVPDDTVKELTKQISSGKAYEALASQRLHFFLYKKKGGMTK